MTRKNWGAGLIVFAAVSHIVIYLVAAPEHVVDDSWPLHGRFHVLQAIGWVIAANIGVATLGYWPLRRGERWAWWALALAWPFLHASYYLSMLAITGGGPPEMSAHIFVGIPAILYLAGIVISARTP